MEAHAHPVPGAAAPTAPWTGAELAALVHAGLAQAAAARSPSLGPPPTERGVLAMLDGAVLTNLGRAKRSSRELAVALELRDALDELRTSRNERGPFLPTADAEPFMTPACGFIAVEIVDSLTAELELREPAWADDLRRQVAAREAADQLASHGPRAPTTVVASARDLADRALIAVTLRDAEADAVVAVRRGQKGGAGLATGLILLADLAHARRAHQLDRATIAALARGRAS